MLRLQLPRIAVERVVLPVLPVLPAWREVGPGITVEFDLDDASLDLPAARRCDAHAAV